MTELVDADSASQPTVSSGGNTPQESEIVSCGNRANHSWYTAAAGNMGIEARRI